MKTLRFVISNFRNLGICEGDKSQEAFLRLSELGGLTILLGKSNSGKSNLLQALEKFGNSYLSLNDSKEFDKSKLLSQDDMPKSPSISTGIGLVCREPSYYLHYPQDVARKSGEARKKQQMGEKFDLNEHLKELQKELDSLKVYIWQEKNLSKLLLKKPSGSGRFMQITVEPLKSDSNYPVDKKLQTEDSTLLHCPFVVGYEELNVEQNFADYIKNPSLPVQSSVVKENGYTIYLENEKLHQRHYATCMNIKGDKNILFHHHKAQENSDEKHDQLRIPRIVFYKETQFCDDDLLTTPDKIRESKLFKGRITKNIMQIIQGFNALYGTQEGEENYRFELNIDIDKFALEIYRGEQLLSLEKQGSGFKRLFDFVFSLAQQIDGLQKGDIVLIDDVEESLSGSIQMRLRKYLKELAQKRGILFIVSTHSPFMIDCNCLDEIRLLKAKDNGLGMEIVELANADGTIKENELDCIADIVGVDLRKFSEACKQE